MPKMTLEIADPLQWVFIYSVLALLGSDRRMRCFVPFVAAVECLQFVFVLRRAHSRGRSCSRT